MNYAIRTTDELYHHGILGQKWGVRRYQNEDGTLTEAGKKRLNDYKSKALNEIEARYKGYDKGFFKRRGDLGVTAEKNRWEEKLEKANEKGSSEKTKNRLQKNIDYYDEILKKSEIMKNIEKRSIEELTFDNMQKERTNLGKEVTKDVLKSIGMTALGTTAFQSSGTGFVMYALYSSGTAGQINSDYRINNNATDSEKRELSTLSKYQKKEIRTRYK